MNKFTLSVLSVIAAISLAGCDGEGGDSSSNGTAYSGTGQSGSLAAMTLLNGELHIIDDDQIKSFSLAEPMAPAKKTQGFSVFTQDAETLFNYNGEYLMVGTELGVQIFAASEDPEVGFEFVSEFTHVRAYDPVIAANGLAYYTTRDGSDVSGGQNDVLGLLDISDIKVPQLIDQRDDLIEPFGLALHKGDLYVCDAGNSLTRFTFADVQVAVETVDANGNVVHSEHTQPAFERQELNVSQPCFDVIALDDHLILTTSDGIVQYKIDEQGLTELS